MWFEKDKIGIVVEEIIILTVVNGEYFSHAGSVVIFFYIHPR